MERLTMTFVYSLNPQRLKSVKRGQYKLLGAVRGKCECCNEFQVYDQEGLDIINSNIKMISQRQMGMKV